MIHCQYIEEIVNVHYDTIMIATLLEIDLLSQGLSLTHLSS